MCKFMPLKLALILYSCVALSNGEDLNIPFYEGDGFAVYPSSNTWCIGGSKYSDNINLDIVYNVSHAQRDKKLFYGSSNSHYSRFFNRIIIPIIAKRCSNFRGWRATAKLHFNTREDWSSHNRRDWDRLRFEYTRNNRAKSGLSGIFKAHYISDRALASKSKKAAERRDYAKQQGHPFRALAGGAYLDTIYNGVFSAQDEVAWYYLSQIQKGNKNDVAMGVLLSMLSSTLAGTKKNMTLLEEVSMYYLKRSTQRTDDCFDAGAVERTFTYNYPELVYEDGYRIPASQIQSKYRINAKFTQLCDRLCEKQGVLYSVANGMNAKMEKLKIADLFRGVDEMLKYYSCRSPEIKIFEDNLLEFNRKEFSQPISVRRNTFQNMLDGSITKYLPLALQPHSRIADQFMAGNYKKPGVVTTTSGLQYILINPGRGQHPKPGDVVSIFYKLTQASGPFVDKRYISGTPKTASIDNYRKGLNEGIRLLKPGGRIKIFVPPELGYGAKAAGSINQDSVLIYEIELLSSPSSPSHIGEPYTIGVSKK